MITATFDKHELLWSIEGFARGSHLRQHIWQKVFEEYLPQLTEDEQDFLWFYLRRDIWSLYFDSKYHQCGCEDFLHTMAALHRGNRANVRYTYNGESGCVKCYRHDGHWRPFDKGFHSFLADEYIVKVEQDPMPNNRYVERGKEDWWHDLSVYNKTEEELRNNEKEA